MKRVNLAVFFLFHCILSQPGKKVRLQYYVALPSALSSGIILIRAGEISRSMPPGHFNALFVKDVDALDLPDVPDALGESVKQGGFIIWNHPGWRKQQPDTTKWWKEHDEIYRRGWMHGIEVFNEKEWYPEAMFAKRTATLFFNKLVGRKELIEHLINQSLRVESPHLYLDGWAYFTVKNLTDIEFTMVKPGTDKSELPERTVLPRRATIILRAKQPKGQQMTLLNP